MDPGMARTLLSFIAFVAAALFGGVAPIRAASVSEIKACIEGVYELTEFKRASGEVLKTPQISGHYMILNGAVFWTYHNRSNEKNQLSFVGTGRYTLSAEGFAYVYEDFSAYTHKPEGITVSSKLPWEGMLNFAPVTDADGLHLVTSDGKQRFRCVRDGLAYINVGNFTRVYRRLPPL